MRPIRPNAAGSLTTSRALLGNGGKDTRFALRRKPSDPLSGRTKAGLIAAMLVFGALPYTEELWRCLRTRPTLGKTSPPAEPATTTLRQPEIHSGHR
jgi:hypothetical protein